MFVCRSGERWNDDDRRNSGGRIEFVFLPLPFHDTAVVDIVKETEKETVNIIQTESLCGEGDGKLKAAATTTVGGKHLKSSPHCLLYTPGFSRLDYPSENDRRNK